MKRPFPPLTLSALVLCAIVAACAAPVVAPPPEPYFRDASFAPASERHDADDVFVLSDAMERFLRVEIATQLRSEGPVRGLINALFRRDQLKLD